VQASSHWSWAVIARSNSAVAGALADGRSVGLLYIDRDTDLNPPSASDGALDWTGVAHLLDLEGAAPELSTMGPRRPMLSDRDILYLAADLVTQTPLERGTMRAHGLNVIEVDDVHRNPRAAVQRAIDWGKSFDRLVVHLDVDVLSFTRSRSRRASAGWTDSPFQSLRRSSKASSQRRTWPL
jgi:arginase